MGLDEAVLSALSGPPWSALLPLSGALFYLGSSAGWWALAAALAALRRWPLALPLALALVLADGSAYVLKEAVARPRPEGAAFAGSDFAFPSGHTMRAAAAAGLAWAAGLPRGVRAGAAAFAVAMALGRVVARAHWPSDVLASLVLGAALGAAAAAAYAQDWAGFRTLTTRLGVALRARAARTRGPG